MIPFLFFLFCLRQGLLVALAVLEPTDTLLLLSPACWDQRHVLPHPAVLSQSYKHSFSPSLWSCPVGFLFSLQNTNLVLLFVFSFVSFCILFFGFHLLFLTFCFLWNLCWLVLSQLDTSQSHLGIGNSNWENAPTTLASRQACGTFSWLLIDEWRPSYRGWSRVLNLDFFHLKCIFSAKVYCQCCTTFHLYSF